MANSGIDNVDLAFDASGLDTWAEEHRFEVTRERIIEYAEATNDPIEAHRSGELAPPVFAIVPAFHALMEPALEVVPVELIPRLVHGEQDFRFHGPIVAGDRLVSRGKMIGYEGLPNGTRSAIYLECRTEDGELVNEQYVTAFFRGFDAGENVGAQAPGHKFDERLRATPPAAKLTQHVDEDQTFRYGPAAGDPMPIHLDDEIARSAGLPGIIAHGLCTLAFTSWAVLTEVTDGRSERLRRLAVRFSKPVLPGQDITTHIWNAGSAEGGTAYAYETTVGDDLVIKDGYAVVDGN